MITLISQMLGCLIVAAGIGGIVGWLIRNLSTLSLEREFAELSTTLRKKEQVLETAQYELKVKTSAIQIMESKVIGAEALARSAQKDLAGRTDRITALQEDLAITTQRLAIMENELAAWHQQATDGTAAVTEHVNEIARLTMAYEEARQAVTYSEQELHQQHQRVAELEATLAASEHLRARVQELEPAQGRVHWLEVQMSEKDAHHRTALQDLEQELARRDQVIRELEPLRQQLQARTDDVHKWEQRYANTAERHAKECAGYEERLAMLQNLEVQLARQQQASHEKDRQIRTLKQQLHDMESLRTEIASQTKLVGEKEEEINRLRKRLVEVRAALRIRTDWGSVAPRPVRQAGNQLTLQIGQTKPTKDAHKDDLKKITGIGPVFERVLNKMGIFTFRKIAKWDASDMKRIADKLETAPDRIKRDKWIAEAKKQHFQKYGERL